MRLDADGASQWVSAEDLQNGDRLLVAAGERLAAEGELASSVLRDRAFPVSMGVEWKPTARITATAFGGAILGGSLQFKEDGGEDIFEEDYDVTPMVGGSLMILF